MIYIGIDPGKDGAMAIIWESGGIEIVPFSPEGYRDALAECPPMECRCCLERVGPMPKQGVTSMFKFGENFGFIQGLLTANRIPFGWSLPRSGRKNFRSPATKTVLLPCASGCSRTCLCAGRTGARRTMTGWQRRFFWLVTHKGGCDFEYARRRL